MRWINLPASYRAIFLALTLPCLILSCTTVAGIQSAPLDEGVPRTFNAPLNETLQAARLAMSEAGLEMESINEVAAGCWMLVGKKATSWWSAGEVVRVVVEQTSETTTMVRVLSKRKSAINVTAKADYSEDILESIALSLETG